jgi:hypothetical protein
MVIVSIKGGEKWGVRLHKVLVNLDKLVLEVCPTLLTLDDETSWFCPLL